MYNNSSVWCGRPAFTRRTNGWLCSGHYAQQQQSIPAKPRKHQPKWKGLVPAVETDEQIIASIIAAEKQAIEVGTVRQVKFGRLEPISLRYLEAPTVH
jgi:hypothetical protein